MIHLSTHRGLALLLLLFPLLLVAQPPAEDGKLKYTNLTEQEMYLMRFQSICHQIEADADWDAHLATYEKEHAAPAALAGKAGSYSPAKQAEERGLLLANHVPGQVQLAPLAPHFPLQYLYKFYPTEFLKVSPSNSKQAMANEFDIRKNLPEGKERMVADARALPFGEERYFRGMPAKRSEYDFDNQCFYLQPDFSNVVGFSGMYAGSESVKIPLTFIEEYKDVLSKLTIPLAEDKAELLFSRLDQANSLRLWPKVVFTLVDEPVEKPVYVTYNGYNWWTLYPLKFKIKYIDIELINGFYTSGSERIHRIEDLPEPAWTSWAINAGQLTTTGTKGAPSVPLNPESSTTSTNTQATAGNTSTSGNLIGGSTATSQRNFPFMRYYKNRVKEPYVQYAGYAKNVANSIKPISQVQLELCYSYYFEPNMYLLRQLRPSLIFGGLYLGVVGEDQHLSEALYHVSYLDGDEGFRFKLGTAPYGKNLKAAGYKNAVCEILMNADHSVNFTLYDKSGKVQLTSVLQPLDKDAKPPFTNN